LENYWAGVVLVLEPSDDIRSTKSEFSQCHPIHSITFSKTPTSSDALLGNRQQYQVLEDHAFTSKLVLEHAASRLASIASQLGHPEEAFGWLNCVERGIQNGALERSLVEFSLVNTLAIIYMNVGQLDKALPFAERSVQWFQERDECRVETENKLVAKDTVASIYSDLGQRDKAVAIQEEMYKEARRELGSFHPTTKVTKKRLAVMRDSWARVKPSDVQARIRRMTASKGRSIAIGCFYGLVSRKDLNHTEVEIRVFSREKRQYLVRMAGGDGLQLYVKPSNILFSLDTYVYVHGLQNANQYNGKLGTLGEEWKVHY
jgi:tetratricopeptide (TPR) repeat protein